MTHSRAPRLKHIALATAVALAPLSLAGCGTEERTVKEQAYCTTKDASGDHIVVDEDDCDDDNGGSRGGYFIYYGNFGSGYKPGQKLPSGGKSINYNDSKARDKIGLPKTGKITSGKGGFGTTTTHTTSKGGGFGSGHGSSGG